MMILGAILILWLVMRNRGKSQPVAIRTGDQYQRVQDSQGRWWYQDQNTGTWNIWNGKAWQPAPGAAPSIPAPQRSPATRPRGRGSCLFRLITGAVIGLIVVGSISLVAFNFFPDLQLEMGQGDDRSA